MADFGMKASEMTLQEFISDHTYHHSISNSINGYSCSSHCLAESIENVWLRARIREARTRMVDAMLEVHPEHTGSMLPHSSASDCRRCAVEFAAREAKVDEGLESHGALALLRDFTGLVKRRIGGQRKISVYPLSEADRGWNEMVDKALALVRETADDVRRKR